VLQHSPGSLAGFEWPFFGERRGSGKGKRKGGMEKGRKKRRKKPLPK